MAEVGEAFISIAISNDRGLRAFNHAMRKVAKIVSEQPWNEDAKASLRALRVARRELVISTEAPE